MTLYVLRLVLVVSAVVRAVGEVDACAVHALFGESHVEAVVGGVYLRWLCIV